MCAAASSKGKRVLQPRSQQFPTHAVHSKTCSKQGLQRREDKLEDLPDYQNCVVRVREKRRRHAPGPEPALSSGALPPTRDDDLAVLRKHYRFQLL